MYKPSTYQEVAYFLTYLPIYETYFLQIWLPRWNPILTQLRFICDWVIMDIQWMVRWWVLVHCCPISLISIIQEGQEDWNQKSWELMIAALEPTYLTLHFTLAHTTLNNLLTYCQLLHSCDIAFNHLLWCTLLFLLWRVLQSFSLIHKKPGITNLILL